MPIEPNEPEGELEYPEGHTEAIMRAIENDQSMPALWAFAELINYILRDIGRIAEALEGIAKRDERNPLMSGKDVELPPEND